MPDSADGVLEALKTHLAVRLGQEFELEWDDAWALVEAVDCCAAGNALEPIEFCGSLTAAVGLVEDCGLWPWVSRRMEGRFVN